MLFTFAEYFLQINFISLDALSRNSAKRVCPYSAILIFPQTFEHCSDKQFVASLGGVRRLHPP